MLSKNVVQFNARLFITCRRRSSTDWSAACVDKDKGADEDSDCHFTMTLLTGSTDGRLLSESAQSIHAVAVAQYQK